MVFYPEALKEKPKNFFFFKCFNLGPMQALETSQLVPIRSPGISFCQNYEGPIADEKRSALHLCA